jgi:cobalamin biosynthesis protein CobT
MTNRKITYIEESGDLEAEIMTGQQLMDATTTVVRTIARDHGTDVVFAGSGAATDGRNVLLPSIPTDAKITRRQALVTGGFANHESLHKLLTDFNATGKLMKKWHAAGKKLTRSMANAIEDIRIEAGGQVLYNGLPKSIDKTAREVNREFIDKIYPQDPSIVNDFRKIGPVAVTWEGRRRLGYPDPSMAEAMALLPEDVRKRVNKIVDQVMKLEHGVEGMGRVNQVVAYRGSLDAYKMAERIVRAYEKEKEDERAKLLAQAQGNGDGTQQGKVDSKSEAKSGSESPAGESSSDEKGTTEAKSGGDESKPDQETGDAPTKSEGEGEVTKDADHGRDAEVATDKQGDSGGGVGATVGVETGDEEEPEPVSAELSRIVQTVLGEILQSDGGYRVLNASEDEAIKPKVHPHDRLTYQAIKSGMGPELGTVRRKLERVLVAMKESGWENGKRSGRLNVRRNARKIIELRPDVFKKRVEESTVNAAMSVLVDLSGSMSSDGKLRLATQATIAVVEALDGTGIPIEVSGHYTFVSGLTKQVWDDMDEDMKRAVSRAQSIRNIVFKGFDDPLSRCRDGIGGMPRMSSGANADGDAILMAAKRLLDRREDRKVMLVLSDGQPAYSAYNRDIHKHTRDCVQWCVEQGIEIVGLGIKSNAVERYYPRHVVVHSMEGFAKTYIDEVAKLLTGRAVSSTGQLIASGVRRGTRL